MAQFIQIPLKNYNNKKILENSWKNDVSNLSNEIKSIEILDRKYKNKMDPKDFIRGFFGIPRWVKKICQDSHDFHFETIF